MTTQFDTLVSAIATARNSVNVNDELAKQVQVLIDMTHEGILETFSVTTSVQRDLRNNDYGIFYVGINLPCQIGLGIVDLSLEYLKDFFADMKNRGIPCNYSEETINKFFKINREIFILNTLFTSQIMKRNEMCFFSLKNLIKEGEFAHLNWPLVPDYLENLVALKPEMESV